jgi:hypothetical protein
MPSVIQALLEKINEQQVLRDRFPNLQAGSYRRTSNPTGTYNCIAHAAYDCKFNWWPLPAGFEEKDRYWPKGAPPRRTIRAFRKAFEIQGFELCDDGNLEAGYEKVVLYVSNKATGVNPLNAPTHMARQLPCGNWTSKLGPYIDIMHDTPERLTGDEYGRVELYMQRPRMLVTIGEDDAKTKKEE